MIKLKVATIENKECYKNLFNILHNDISPYNDELKDVDENGYFDEQAVDVYFENNESVIPYLIYSDEKIAGAVVLSKPPYVKPGCDYCIQELVILGLYRGKSVAEEAISSIFKEYNNKGKYCVIVLKENKRAMGFWSKIINKYGVLDESIDLNEKTIAYTFNLK